jgi:hypothetical protein
MQSWLPFKLHTEELLLKTTCDNLIILLIILNYLINIFEGDVYYLPQIFVLIKQSTHFKFNFKKWLNILFLSNRNTIIG